MKRIIVVAAVLLAITIETMAIQVKRIEPTSWWVGMKHPLQLMFYGTDLRGASLSVNSSDITIEGTHSADSPNYLFADLKINPNTPEGEYIFTLKKGGQSIQVPYRLNQRHEGSATRKGFTPQDVIYLLMPDRFAATGSIDSTQTNRGDPHARHGGNLQGMIDHLDYIDSLGATAIWSTPLTLTSEPEGSYHGYAAADFYMIDPRLGSNKLYQKYVQQAHQRGLKIVQDLVPNHSGAAHWWMQDLPFKDWVNNGGKYVQTRYAQTAQSDPHASRADFQNNRDGWFVESMPDLNMRNPFMLNYLAQNAIWWAEYAGVDGFRVDTYPYNDKHAAAEWTGRILNEYPQMSIVGECWVNEPSLVSYWDGAARNRDGYSSRLSSVMDFPLQQRIIESIARDSTVGWGSGAMGIYNILAQDFLYADPNTLLIFAENHDTDRLAHATKGNAKKQMMAYTLLATMRGTPQLYYGSEQLLRGDQSKGHGGQRVDFPGGWISDTINLFDGKGRSRGQDSVLRHVQKMFQWRKTSQAAQGGDFIHFFPDAAENLYAYARTTANELVFVVLNLGREAQTIDWARYAELFEGRPTSGTDVVSGRKITVGNPLTIPAHEALVLQIKNRVHVN